jgi:hypothetical protein
MEQANDILQERWFFNPFPEIVIILFNLYSAGHFGFMLRL